MLVEAGRGRLARDGACSFGHFGVFLELIITCTLCTLGPGSIGITAHVSF